jgi:uncharacterized protein YcbK (DUF882 family)
LKGPLDLSRRRLFSSTLATAAAFLLPSPLKASLEKLARESAGEMDVRSLSFHNTHTDERLEAPYFVSGYRSPRSNEMLRTRSGAVARHSLHLKGMAADVRLTGVPLRRLRDAALDMKMGGVGYYTDEFLHVDTGRVRSW